MILSPLCGILLQLIFLRGSVCLKRAEQSFRDLVTTILDGLVVTARSCRSWYVQRVLCIEQALSMLQHAHYRTLTADAGE